MIYIKTTVKKQDTPEFPPRTLEITIESQDEFDRLASLFNITKVNSLLNSPLDIDYAPIHGALSSAGGNTTRFYDKFREELRKA